MSIVDSSRLEDQSSVRGLTVIGKGRNCDSRLFKIEKCGHEAVVTLTSLFRGRGPYKCKQCTDQQIAFDAEENNLTLVHRKENGKSMYMCNVCHHIFDAQNSHVKRGNVRCRACARSMEAREANRYGLSLISGPLKGDTNRRLYRFSECGHEQKIRRSDVSVGRFACRECGKHSWTKESNVYLIRFKSTDGFEWLKLGYAKSIEARVKNYGLKNVSDFDVIVSVKVETGKAASDIEKGIHLKYKKCRLSSDLMRNYHTKSGFTECYPPNLIDKLAKEFK